MQWLYGYCRAGTRKEVRARVDAELREEHADEIVDEVCLICSECSA